MMDDAVVRDKSQSTQKSKKSGKSHNSHKSYGKKQKKVRTSEVKVSNYSNITDMDNVMDQSSLDNSQNALPLSIEKYSVIENIKNMVIKGDFDRDTEHHQRLRVQKQYKSSQHALMALLHSPTKEGQTAALDANDFLGDRDFMTFQNNTVDEHRDQILSEQENEAKSSAKTPLSKGKSVKEKSSQKSKKKKK